MTVKGSNDFMAIVVNGQRVENEVIAQEMQNLQPAFMQWVAQQQKEMSENEMRMALQQAAEDSVIKQELLRQHCSKDDQPVEEEEIQRGMDIIRERLGGQEALDNYLTDDLERRVQLRNEIALQIKVERLINGLSDKIEDPSEEEVRQAFEEHRENCVEPEAVKLRHILKRLDGKDDEETLMKQLGEVREKLEAGADFAAMAEEHSDDVCPGGELGFVERGQFDPTVEQIIFDLEPGQMSKPELTVYGCHLFAVDEYRPQRMLEFDEVKEQIAYEIAQDRTHQALEAFIDEQREAASVERVQ